MLQGIKIRPVPIADLNSSFDDIDSAHLGQASSDGNEEKQTQAEVAENSDNAPFKRITYNPKTNPFDKVPRSLLPASGWRQAKCNDGYTTDLSVNTAVSYTHLTLPTKA